MNLAELVTRVYDRASIAPTDASVTADKVRRALNDALRFIEVDRDWPWNEHLATLSTVAGQGSYPLPADWAKTRRLRVPGERPMDRLSPLELDDAHPDDAQGTPRHWAVEGDELLLRPVPDGVYAVRHHYLRAEPDLVVDADTPRLPARFHPALVEAAAWLVLRGDREDVRALADFGAFGAWRERMVDDARRHTGPARVRVRRG